MFNTSTGSGIPYEAQNKNDPTKIETGDAQTPEGLFKTTRERPEGWWEGDLGKIYRPKYFVGGVAVHGMTSVPNHPASHGCVRLSTMAMDFIWDQNLIPLHTVVWVHQLARRCSADRDRRGDGRGRSSIPATRRSTPRDPRERVIGRILQRFGERRCPVPGRVDRWPARCMPAAMTDHGFAVLEHLGDDAGGGDHSRHRARTERGRRCRRSMTTKQYASFGRDGERPAVLEDLLAAGSAATAGSEAGPGVDRGTPPAGSAVRNPARPTPRRAPPRIRMI